MPKITQFTPKEKHTHLKWLRNSLENSARPTNGGDRQTTAPEEAGQRKDPRRITGCGGDSTPTRRPEAESDGKQRPKVETVGNPDTTTSGGRNRRGNVETLVDVDEDSAKISLRQ